MVDPLDSYFNAFSASFLHFTADPLMGHFRQRLDRFMVSFDFSQSLVDFIVVVVEDRDYFNKRSFLLQK